MKVFVSSWTLLALALLYPTVTWSDSELFDANAPALEVELRGPFSAVFDNAGSNEEYPFVVVVDGRETPVKVRARGRSRQRVCEFPPLRLNFAKKTSAGSDFAGQDKLKLVTHCGTKAKDAGNLQDELLAYQLLNHLTPLSYRVRRLEVRYVDTVTPAVDGSVHEAFLIESDKQFAKRHGMKIIEEQGVYLSRVDADQAAMVYVFQYLIGNTDWSLVKADLGDHCCHNIDLFERDGKSFLVPYDYDLAGLVDASYAKPDPSLGIRNVRTRRYRGYCVAGDALERAYDSIVSLQPELLELAASGDDLHSPKRVNYLKRFFDEAQKREKVLARFERRCL
jgi:hypothetical protein